MISLFDLARAVAQRTYADPSSDNIEIADNARVTRSADSGFWVEARVYVHKDDIRRAKSL